MRTLRSAGWGIFCTCSWTWCIGMFLPMVMYVRYGWIGFVVFAVPNVIGCAGLGYVLRTPERSRRMVAAHGRAAVVFSSVAIAYHVFFMTYVLSEWLVVMPAWPQFPLFAAAGVVVAGLALSRLPDGAWLLLGALVFVTSCVIFGALAGADVQWPTPERDARELFWLGPVIAVGFLLCPYLDLTFHRALQRSPSRHAFGVFGVTFTVMILMTCVVWFAAPQARLALGTVHVLAQAVFTVGAHEREIRTSPAFAPTGRWLAALLPLAAIGLLPAARLINNAGDTGLDVYIRFLVAYGLLFPLYVVVFIGPARPVPLGRTALIACVIAAVALMPAYEAGFIHGTGWPMAIPMVLLVAWLIGRRRLGDSLTNRAIARPDSL